MPWAALVGAHGVLMWVPWHAHGHYKPRLEACHGVGTVACPWALQTEVSGMPWPALVCVVACHGLPWLALACHGGLQGMPWPALVRAVAFLGLLPWWAWWKGVVACPLALQTEVSGMPQLALVCRGMPWPALGGAVASHGLPWCEPWLSLACLGGAMACHGRPWWVPWHAIMLNPVPRCIYSFGNDQNCASKFFIGHLECVPCFNFH